MKPAKDPVRALIKASVIVVLVVAAIIGLFVFRLSRMPVGPADVGLLA
ncbi:MAG: hypothetical protein KIT15_07075 [Xanthobacteraceae bacterium]|nr:hypothetical protein [Xanthobacteraceae bacterium]